jgi:HEAT repeat protein
MRCPLSLPALAVALSLVAAGCSKKSDAPVKVEDGGAADGKGPGLGKALDRTIGDLKANSVAKRAAALRGITQFDPEEAIPSLVEALDDKTFTEGAVYPGEPNSTREAVVLALLKLGAEGEKALTESGLPVLIKGLKDDSNGVREHTALAIGLLGAKGKPTADALTNLCGEKNDNVRRAAYDALARVGGASPKAIAVLLNRPDSKVAYDAARALNTMRPLPKDIIPALESALKKPVGIMEPDEVGLTRMEVAEALAGFGKDAAPAVPALVGVLKATTEEDFDKYFRPRTGGDPSGQRNDESPAMMALRKIGKPAVPALVEALKDDSPLVRWQAAMVLAGIGPDAKEALPALKEARDAEIKRPEVSPDVVTAAALAEVQLGGDPAEPVAAVVELLKTPNAQLRYYVARVLGRFGRKGAGATEALTGLLDDMAEAVRAQAADSLRALGPAAKSAIPALAKKLADEDEAVRRSALDALKALGPVAAEAAPEMAKLLGMEGSLQRAAAEALAAIGPGARTAVPALAKLLHSKDDREKTAAAEALTAIGPGAKAAAPDLVAMLEEKDSELQVTALKALEAIASADANVVQALSSRLTATHMRVRVAAVRALAALGPAAKSAAPNLQKFGGAGAKTPNPVTAVWAAAALHRIGVEPNTNLQVVLDALTNKEPAGKAARLAAMDAADVLGTGAKAALPELTDALNDKTPIGVQDKTPVRQRAIAALGKMGAAAKPAVPKMVALLREKDSDLKRATLEALGRIGPAADFATARLREIVRTEPAFAEQAQEALDRIEAK